MHFPIARLIRQAPHPNTMKPESKTCQSPDYPRQTLHSAKNELLGHRRTCQVRIKQDAATHSSVQVYRTLNQVRKGHTLQEIRQPNPPFLQERRAEFIFAPNKNQPGLPTKFLGVRGGDAGRAHRKDSSGVMGA